MKIWTLFIWKFDFIGGLLGGLGMSFLGGAMGGMGQGMGAGVSSGLGSMMGDKWFGAPQPEDSITLSSQMMDSLYPGTTPFERLSRGGGGAPSAGAITNSADVQATNQREIASLSAMTEIAKANMSKDVATRGQDLTSGLIENPGTAALIRNMDSQTRLNEEKALFEMSQVMKNYAEIGKIQTETDKLHYQMEVDKIVAKFPGTVFAKLYSTGNPAQWANMKLLIDMIRNTPPSGTGVTKPKNRKEATQDEFFSKYIDMGYR